MKPRPAHGSSADRLAITAPVLKTTLVGGLIVLLYQGVATDLAVDWWTQPALSYGLLIPPLALYYAWWKRRSIEALPAAPDSKGLILVGLSCLMYLAGRLGAEFFVQRLSMITLFAALIWTFWGARRLRRLAFPLVLLAAAVPLPVIIYNLLAAPLQLFASAIATELARLAGVTVHRDGNVLQLAWIALGVEEACSGLNSLSALVVGALLLGNALCARIPTKLLVLLSAVPIAISVNVLRVAGTAILADFKLALAMGYYHLLEGWLVFLLGFAALAATARLLSFLMDRKKG